MYKIILSRVIHPQRRVDLIVSVDFAKEKIDVRPTVIYDVDEFQKRVIIAQTNPPILKSMVGRNVEATFLTRVNPGEDPKRVGYKTKIMGLLPKYLLRQGGQEQALAIGFPRKGLEETSVRLHYRVFPSQNHQMSVSIDNESSGISLADLSLGGMRISCVGGREFQKGQKLSLVLKIEDKAVALEGTVVRVFSGENSRVSFVGIKFGRVEPQATALIQRMVSRIMRQELKARSGLGGKRP